MEWTAELDALAETARAGDPDRFEAALLAPPEARARLIAFTAFLLEIARTPWRVSEPQIGVIRLKWWRDAVAEIYAGAPPRAHAVVAPLAAALRSAGPPEDLVYELIDARVQDLEPGAMASRAAFDAYVAATGGAAMRVAATLAVGAPTDPETDAAAAEAGWAMGAAGLLRAIPALAAQDRVWLPPPEDGGRVDLSALARGETPPALRAICAAAARDAAARLAQARRRRIDSRARPALLAAWRTAPTLRAAQRPDLDVFRDYAPESPFRRRASLMWRAFRGW